jgi:valyl-tRNA synthetase
MNISPSKNVSVVVDAAQDTHRKILNRNMDHIKVLAKAENVSVGEDLPKPEGSATAVVDQISIHVLLKGLIDFEEEKQRIRKGIKKLEKEYEAANKKLSNQGFLEKAPAEIVSEVREKVAGLSAKRSKLKENLSCLEGIDG